MRVYLSYFKLRLINNLQYREAAIAGIFTQIFFGFIYVMVYLAFYENNVNNAPMNLNQIISYLWLNQIFFSLINLYYKDSEIIDTIKNGNISYELCRPLKLYWIWFSKILSTRIANLVLRMFPVMVLAIFLPEPYNLSLPINSITLILSILSISISSILITSIINLYHVIAIYTLDEKGISNIIISIGDILSGLVVPIPFFPKFLQIISNYLPFKYISDLPFRIYTSHISINDGIIGIIIQLSWIIILISGGLILMKKALKKAVIQGG